MEIDPRRIESAVRRMNERQRFSVSGELRALVITALWEYLDRRRPHPDFTIDEWDETGRNRRRIIAGTSTWPWPMPPSQLRPRGGRMLISRCARVRG